MLLKERRAFVLSMALSTDRVILFPSNCDLFTGWDAHLKQLLLGYQGGEGQAWSPLHQECILPPVSPGTEPLQDWGLQNEAVPQSHTPSATQGPWGPNAMSTFNNLNVLVALSRLKNREGKKK